MHGLFIFGLIMAVGVGGSAVIALVILIINRRARTQWELQDREGSERRRPLRTTRVLFVMFAYASVWIAIVGLSAARMAWVDAESTPKPKLREDADLNRSYQESNAMALFATAVVAIGLAIAGCAGIRTGRGAAAILPGSVLGFVLSIALAIAAFVHLIRFGVEILKGPYV
jgi:hypothetical protein